MPPSQRPHCGQLVGSAEAATSGGSFGLRRRISYPRPHICRAAHGAELSVVGVDLRHAPIGVVGLGGDARRDEQPCQGGALLTNLGKLRDALGRPRSSDRISCGRTPEITPSTRA